MADLVTLAKVKAFLRETSTANDATISDLISWASERITREISTVSAEAVTEIVTAGDIGFILRRTPVLSVTSVTPVDSVSATVDVADLQVVDSLAGHVRTVNGAALSGLYTVVYSAGRDLIPASIEGATLSLVRHWWNQSQAHGSATYGDSGFVPDFKDLPNTVQNMLAVTPKMPGIA